MGLHDLAPELLLVFLEVTAPGDLPAIIKASSACFRVYQRFKKQILAASLTNAMEPEALQAALALADFKSFDCPIYAIPVSSSKDAGKVDAYGRPKKRTFGLPSDIPSLISMCITHKQVSFFVEDFAKSAILKVREILIAPKTRSQNTRGVDTMRPERRFENPLSRTERARFERAFYRHELYSQINPCVRDDNVWRPAYIPLGRPLTRYSLIIGSAQDWEVTEMLCVHLYLKRVVVAHIHKARNDLVKAVLAMPGVTKINGWQTPAGRKRLQFDPQLEIDSSYPISGFLGWIALQGLEFLTRLSSADPEERGTLLRGSVPFNRSLSLEIHERRNNDPQIRKITSTQEGIMSDADGKDCGTLGFRAIHQDSSSSGVQDSRDRDERLWERAYPFWDADRMRPDFVIDAFKRLRFYDWSRYLAWWRNAWGPHPETRLQGITVTKAEFEELQRRFGMKGVS